MVKTSQPMDILFSSLIISILGGSQREEDLQKLSMRMEEMDICKEEFILVFRNKEIATHVHSQLMV